MSHIRNTDNTKGEQTRMHKREYANSNGELLTIGQVCSLANLGESTVRRLADESQSSRRIGKALRVNKKIFFDYIEKVYSV